MPSAVSSGRVSAFLRHPLVAIVVSSVIGSLLVPGLVERIQARKQLRDRKHAVAVKIFEKALADSSNLAELDTILRNAYRSNPPEPVPPGKRAAENKRRKELEKAQAAFGVAYLQFNKIAWYWPWQLCEEAQIEGALKGGTIGEFSTMATAYSAELLAVSHREKQLWVRLGGAEAVPELVDDRNKELEASQARLYAHAKTMAQLVLAPPSCRIRVLCACLVER